MATPAATCWIVRAISVTFALLVMYLYSTARLQVASLPLEPSKSEMYSWSSLPINRHLLSVAGVGVGVNGSLNVGDGDKDNCTKLRDHHGYKDTCAFVKNECRNEIQLLDYLGFVVCQMKNTQVRLLPSPSFLSLLPLPPSSLPPSSPSFFPPSFLSLLPLPLYFTN